MVRRILSFAALLVPAALAAQGPQGVITGRVVSAVNLQPVAEATVEVVGTGRTARTLPSGRFVLDSVPAGVWRVRAAAIGFEPALRSDVVVSSGRPVEVELRLAPRAVELEELVAEAPYFAPPTQGSTSTQSLGAEEVRRAPGVQEDVVRAVALLPGVGVTTGGRNDLVVRGGAPFENLFLVDGIEVPNLNHFGSQGSTGGPVSLLNINFVREASFSSGGFGAAYGDRTASVTRVDLREGNAERLAGAVNLSATGAFLIGEGPLGRNGTFLASVRRSYLDLIFEAAGFSFIPTYWDGQLKLTQRLGDRHTLSFVGIGALDELTLNYEEPDDVIDNSRIAAPELRTYIAGLTWQWALPRGLFTATAGRTFTRFRAVQRDTLLNPVFTNASREGDNSLRTDLTLQLSPAVGLTVGNTLRYASELRYDLTLPGTVRRDETGAERPLAVDTSFTAFRNATYAEAAVAVGRARLTAGLRGDYYAFLGDAWRLAPRLGARLPAGARGTVTLSAGRYWQATPFVWLTGDAGNPARLEPIRGDQLVAGYERALRPDLKAQVEVYYKRYARYPVRLFRPQAVLQPAGFDDVTSDIPLGLEPLASTGTGRTYGVEFFVQKRLSEVPVYGLASVTINRSEFTALDGIERPGAFETRFLATFLAGWRPNAKWELSGKLRVATGLPATPFLTSGDLAGQRDFSRYNAERLPTFHALDIRVDRRWSWSGVQLAAYIDVQNVYGRENVSALQWNPRARVQEFDESLGTLPSIGVTVEF